MLLVGGCRGVGSGICSRVLQAWFSGPSRNRKPCQNQPYDNNSEQLHCAKKLLEGTHVPEFLRADLKSGKTLPDREKFHKRYFSGIRRGDGEDEWR